MVSQSSSPATRAIVTLSAVAGALAVVISIVFGTA